MGAANISVLHVYKVEIYIKEAKVGLWTIPRSSTSFASGVHATNQACREGFCEPFLNSYHPSLSDYNNPLVWNLSFRI